jgi:Cu+-exporting ATPase
MAEHVELTIRGMTCASCAARVERALANLPGVVASVDLVTGVAVAEIAESGTSPTELVHAVERAGYQGDLRAGRADSSRHLGSEKRLVLSLLVACGLRLLRSSPKHRSKAVDVGHVLAAAVVSGGGGFEIHRRAARELRQGTPGMDSLTSVGSCVGLIAAVASLVRDQDPGRYADVPIGVTVATMASRQLAEMARDNAGSSIRTLLSTGAHTATRIGEDGCAEQVPVEALRPGDLVAVDAGGIVPADCAIEAGRTALDLSLITGEAVPIEVGPGDRAPEGCLNVLGRIEARVHAVGADATLGRLATLMSDARSERARVQALADRVIRVFVPGVLVLSTTTGLAWWLRTRSIDETINPMVAILVAACPCALGLATPAALAVARGRGAALGVLIRSPRAIEIAGDIDTVIFDKTGTLTDGTMRLQRVVVNGDADPNDVLAAAAAIEQTSSHPIGRALERAACEQLGQFRRASWVESPTPAFQRGRVGDRVVAVERVDDDLQRLRTVGERLWRGATEAIATGRIALLVNIDGQAAGILVLGERVRPDAPAGVTDLNRLGLSTVLMTGDELSAARAVADACGLNKVLARQSAADKLDLIRRLQADGRRIAYVGDGLNDAAALSQADLGIAVENATDVASTASDIALMRADLDAVATAIGLARATRRTIRQNLGWAVAYNAITLPLAASGRLRAVTANALMGLSGLAVLANSLRLRSYSASLSTDGDEANEQA